MMSKLREDLLNAIGVTYRTMSDAIARGDGEREQRALKRIGELKRRLRDARSEERHRYLHISNSERSCMVCRDEDSSAVVVQAWNSCEGCETTRFRSFEAAHRALQQAGYIPMRAV